jgi:hypothetical protein
MRTFLSEARMHDVFENYVKPALSSLKKDFMLEKQGRQVKLSFLPSKSSYNQYYIKEDSTIPPLEGVGKINYGIELEVTIDDKETQKGGFNFDVIKF